MRHQPINYPGLEAYSVTDTGEVIGKDGVRKISQFKTSRGYLHVGLYIRGDTKRKFAVHRLVALTYVPNPENKPQVDHIDGNKLNNHASNLQWLTGSENVAKAFKQGRVGSRKGKLSGKLTGLYLTNRAVELLGAVENKSKYVSALIEKDLSVPVNAPVQTSSIKSPDVSDLLKPSKPGWNNLPEPKIPNPLPDAMDILASNAEYDCCQHPTRPCKHWVWDTSTGEGYKNTLSGRYREAE